MSIFNNIATLVGGQLEDILLRRGRSIGSIIPQVVIEEQHRDELAITNHPVQNGANITDHAFKQPAMLTMHCGWSESGSIYGPWGGSSDPRSVYEELLQLQSSRQPFDVVTGKRTYQNMLIRSLEVVTDKESENSLFVTAEFQEIILVDTQETILGSADNMTNPESTAPISDVGVKQPQQQQESILSKLSKGASSIFGF